MRIETAPHFVELLITEVVPSGMPSEGDVRIEAKAQINGFVGFGSCWVGAREFKAFSIAAKQLLSSSKGIARLESISPGEFSLSLSPANPRGYFSVQVAISKRSPAPCAMSGTFEVEPPSLTQLVPWSQAPRVRT
jgi:hypothetical protein